MGGYTPKCATSRLGYAQRESRLALRESSNHGDQNVQSCNLLGSSTRPSCMKSSQAWTSDRVKYAKSIPRSASGKLLTGSSSKTHTSSHNNKKQHKEPQNSSSHKETVPNETRSIQIHTQVSNSILSTPSNQSELSEARTSEPGVLKDASVNIPEEVEGYGGISITKTQRRFHQRSALGSQNTSFGSHKLSSATSKVRQAASSSSQGGGGLRKLGCTSISDVPRSDRPSSYLSHSKRAEVVKKRSDGECSASRQSTGRSSSRLTLSDRPSTQEVSKRTRKQILARDDVASISGEPITGDNGVMTSRHGKGNRIPHPDPLHGLPRRRQSELSIRISSPPTSSQQPACTFRQNSHRRPGGNNETVDDMLTGYTDNGTTHPLHGLVIDQDSFNTDEIDEVLSALERIERDVELTYEQRLVLESNLFLDGFSFLDQHREMRLDIDGMSYEQLLDLEEKMGTVSTALTEEALSKCLKRHFYKPVCADARSKSCVDGDDVKCTICQEEYAAEDEVGKLGCDHWYHMMCIHQWLRQKNWCPICKTPAATS